MPGLYIHIPFCRAKCGYCDFASQAGQESSIDAYLEAVALEAALYSSRAGFFDTLYVGGGTPSLLSAAQLARLFAIAGTLTGPAARLKESTFEANPESLDGEKAALLKRSGINRVSLGLQAGQDRLLKRLGRIALTADFLRAYQDLRAAGFANINADLMCGLPGQTDGDFMEGLNRLLALKPEHVSLYALEIHEGTPFAAQGVKEEPEAAAGMYAAAVKALAKAGLERYEISNFSLTGRESAHNLNYWAQGSYLGLGAAAASYLDGERRANAPDMRAYINSLASGRGAPEAYRETLNGRARTGERLMLGLRTTRGIELTDDIFIEFKPEIERLLKAGLVERAGGSLRIKEGCFYVSNAVFREFV